MPIPENAKKPKRLSIKEQIYQTMCEWIVDGTLQPNEPINDLSIAQYFSASRTPVREALLKLEQQGFVEMIPSCGTRVAPMSKAAAAQIYEALAEVSGSAAALAAVRRSTGQLNTLKACNDAFAAAVDAKDKTMAIRHDTDFHDEILQIAENPYLRDFVRQLTFHARRYEYTFFKSGVDKTRSIQDHLHLIQAIEAQDPTAARAYAEQNWLDFYKNRLEQLL